MDRRGFLRGASTAGVAGAVALAVRPVAALADDRPVYSGPPIGLDPGGYSGLSPDRKKAVEAWINRHDLPLNRIVTFRVEDSHVTFETNRLIDGSPYLDHTGGIAKQTIRMRLRAPCPIGSK